MCYCGYVSVKGKFVCQRHDKVNMRSIDKMLHKLAKANGDTIAVITADKDFKNERELRYWMSEDYKWFLKEGRVRDDRRKN